MAGSQGSQPPVQATQGRRFAAPRVDDAVTPDGTQSRPVVMVQAVPIPPDPTPLADYAPKGGAFYVTGRGWVDANGNVIKELKGKGRHHDVHGAERRKAMEAAANPPDDEEEVSEEDAQAEADAQAKAVREADPFNNPVAPVEGPRGKPAEPATPAATPAQHAVVPPTPPVPPKSDSAKK